MSKHSPVNALVRNAYDGDLAKIRLALKRDPSLTTQASRTTGTTPLMIACMKGRLDAAKLLLSLGAGASIHSRCRYGRTALHSAAIGSDARGDTEMIALLLDAVANPALRDNQGLDCAAVVPFFFDDPRAALVAQIRGRISSWSERKALEELSDEPGPTTLAASRKRSL